MKWLSLSEEVFLYSKTACGIPCHNYDVQDVCILNKVILDAPLKYVHDEPYKNLQDIQDIQYLPHKYVQDMQDVSCIQDIQDIQDKQDIQDIQDIRNIQNVFHKDIQYI